MNSRRIGLLFLLLGLLVFPPLTYADTSINGLIEQVHLAIAEQRGVPIEYVRASSLDVELNEDWAFGVAGVVLPSANDGDQSDFSPDLILYFAHLRGSQWVVSLENSPAFQRSLSVSPGALVPPQARSFLSPGDAPQSNGVPAGDGSAQLSFPFPQGETWTFSGGPHSTNLSAIDFARNNGRVVAARDGVVWRASWCANFIRIDHGGGWQTGYYHLVNERVNNGQSVSRGQHIGNTSAFSGCGGRATGPHVDFSLRRNGNRVNIIGKDIGGWTVEDQNAATTYDGCLRNVATGTRICQWGSITNNGQIGSGNGGGLFDQSRLFWNQVNTTSISTNAEHRWPYQLTSARQYQFRIRRTSGNLEFDTLLKDNGGVWLYSSTSTNGTMNMIVYSDPGDYWLHLIPRDGTSGTYTMEIRQDTPPAFNGPYNFLTGGRNWVASGNFLYNDGLSSVNGWQLDIANGSDPILTGPTMSFNASAFRYVAITARISHNSTCTNTRLFFNYDNSLGFSAARRVTTNFVPNTLSTIYFDMTTSSNWTGTIRRLRWDPTECGSSGGTGTVDLQRIELTNTIAVTADFTTSANSVEYGTPITFTSTSSGSPTAFNWAFGDSNTANGSSVTHTYALPGTYEVSLTASRSGTSDTETRRITVTPTPGDCNSDGLITAADLSLISLELDDPGNFETSGCDADGNGVVNSADRACIRDRIFNPLATCTP